MPVEYYKARKGYYYRRGPRGAKRITKEEYDEATMGKPIRRSAVRKRVRSRSHYSHRKPTKKVKKMTKKYSRTRSKSHRRTRSKSHRRTRSKSHRRR